MSHLSPHWKNIESLTELDRVVDDSRAKPALVFKYDPTSSQSVSIKESLDQNWMISPDMVDVFLIDDSKYSEIAHEVSSLAGIPNENPQVVLFADGVTMYDESKELINAKKIKLALKIVNRTFRWMETRA